MRRTIIAALAAACACAGFAHAQQAPLTDEERRAAVASGMAILEVLKDPARCGGAPPRSGYACAVMLYRDSRADDPGRGGGRLPELLTVRVRDVQGIAGPPQDAKVRVLSPFDNCNREFSPFGMQRMRMGLFSNMRGAEVATMELKSVLGWAENEALPADHPRRADPKVFKLPACR